VIDQNRFARSSGNGFGQVVGQDIFIINNGHSPASQHVGGTHQHGITNFSRYGPSLFQIGCDAVRRAINFQPGQQGLKLLPILGHRNGCRRGSPDRDAGLRQSFGQVQWGLPPKLHNDSIRLLHIDNIQHIFQGERFKVKPVGGVS
jgi:hypothetical protein